MLQLVVFCYNPPRPRGGGAGEPNVYLTEYTGAANQLWYVKSGEKALKDGSHNIKNTSSVTVTENWLSTPYIACPAIDHNSTVAFYSSNTSVASRFSYIFV